MFQPFQQSVKFVEPKQTCKASGLEIHNPKCQHCDRKFGMKTRYGIVEGIEFSAEASDCHVLLIYFKKT